jgi:transmembrane sensor
MNERTEPARVDDDAIMAAAAAWLSSRDVGFTEVEAAKFKDWRNSNPHHEAAIRMLEQTRELLEHMPVLRADPELNRRMQQLSHAQPASEKILRFPRALKIASALAACVAIAFVLWASRPDGTAFEATYATTSGDYRRVLLPDGSEFQLNSDTRVQVRFSRAQRQVTLAEGEAHFNVAKNPKHPFIVHAENVGVRAVGTAFNVRVGRADVEVLVTEGRVEVDRMSLSGSTTGITEAASTFVNAGQRISISTEASSVQTAQLTNIDLVAIQAALDWQNPLLMFNDTPLTDVVAKFNRHNRVRLELGDIELNGRTVGGTFRADQVESFVRLLEKSGDVAIERPARERIILRKIAVPANR